MKRTAAAFVSALAVSGLAACSDDVGGGESRTDGGTASERDASQSWTPDASFPSEADASVPPIDAASPDVPADASALFGFPSPFLTDNTLADPEIGRAQVSVTAEDAAGLKTYVLTTTAAIRAPADGGAGAASPRTVREKPGRPRIRTGNLLFDALYALALEELEENAVDSISDGAFNGGRGVPCGEGGCFETGRNWHYVWTRDTAFAAALGTAAIDPERTMRSLKFKLSARRGGGDVQIVQDTGTGGSWPVSTDRVSWALGAAETLRWLDGEARTAFRDEALEAIANTLEHDRATVFDASDGLYFGETSFLDWREQTYPAWMAQDPAQIAATKALSTNLLHLIAMKTASALAGEKGDGALEARYAQWAEALRQAVLAKFLREDGSLASFVTPALGSVASAQSDALSVALAAAADLFDGDEAALTRAVAAYPHAGRGTPVIWPQQQATPIYHNRSHWPFVTAFFARAAGDGVSDRAYDFALMSLFRSAALNLSNMENFELISGRAQFDDPDPSMSGPVVNSQRQLWSVGGYLSMAARSLFGIRALDSGGLTVRPTVTMPLRNTLFRSAEALELKDLPWRGTLVDVRVILPPLAPASELPGGTYGIRSVEVNGVAVRDVREGFLKEDLPGHSQVVVTLEDRPAPQRPWNFVTPDALAAEGGWRRLFAPKAPTVPDLGVSLAPGGGLTVSFAAGEQDASSVVHDIYRDGALVAEGLAGSTTSWTDTSAADSGSVTHCYTVLSRFAGAGSTSQAAKAACHWGEWDTAGWRIQEFFPQSFVFQGGALSEEHGREHLGSSWGKDGDYVEVTASAAFDGDHFVQAVYANGTGALNTSVTCGVKWVRVTDAADGSVVSEGVIAMPALGTDWSVWKESTLFRVSLKKGRTYRIRIGSDENVPRRAVNMSAFSHFETYTGNGGLGGTGGALNDVNIASIKLLALGR